METPMKVNFDDTVQNWRLWGELVEHWIHERHPKPEDTDKLINQMKAHGISGASVYGPTPRPVEFVFYGEKSPLVIELPSKEMLEEAKKTAEPGKPYPLPAFYNDAFEGERKAFCADIIKHFSACRVGEYTINQCM